MKSTRRGVSLISLMVVITILSGLLLMVGTLLRGLLVAEVATAARVSQLRQWEQLTIQFRRDVHAATGADIFVSTEPIGQELQLAAPGGRIDYVLRDGAIERHQPSTSRHDVWRFPDQQTEVTQDAETRLVTLRVTFPAAALDDTIHPAARVHALTIDAELGREHRQRPAATEPPR